MQQGLHFVMTAYMFANAIINNHKKTYATQTKSPLIDRWEDALWSNIFGAII